MKKKLCEKKFVLTSENMFSPQHFAHELEQNSKLLKGLENMIHNDTKLIEKYETLLKKNNIKF